MINHKRVKSLIYKELIELSMDKGIWLPLLILPFIFCIIMPIAIIIAGSNTEILKVIGGLQLFIDNLPKGILLDDINKKDVVTYSLLMYFLVPFFFLIPVIIATSISTNSFVGEKENKTLEGLLYTPLNNRELVLGKILAAALPSIITTWVFSIIYGIILNIYGLKVIEKFIFPNLNWLIILLLLVPLITFLTISLIIFISNKAKSSKSAQSISMIVAVPIIGLLISQSTGLVLFNIKLGLLMSIILIIINIFSFYLISKKFNRDKIITNL